MRFLPRVAYLFIRLLRTTMRIRHANVQSIDDNRRHIVAFWHECILLALHSKWYKPTAALISKSKDGEIVSRVLELYGADTVRGSSSRGGAEAFREALRVAEAGSNIAFTPDGPRGPRRELKEGIIRFAQASGLPIIAFYFTADRKTRLRSWDGQIVPKPFSRGLFLYSDPIVVPPEGDVEEWRMRVERIMVELAERAEAEFDHLWSTGKK